MLYEDNQSHRHVKTFFVDMREKELHPGPWHQSSVEHGTHILIPIPTGGVVLVGEAMLCYIIAVAGDKSIQAVAIQPTAVCAWGFIDADGSRILLGDSKGALWVLVLQRDQAGAVVGMLVDLLGHTTIASSITYLENGVVYLGSQFGDSQLIKLRGNADETGSFVEHLESYANIGPILDMALVDGARAGNSKLVTCSGAYQEGSLRVIRSGIGLHVHASLEIEGIRDMWSLRDTESAAGGFDKFLVQSFTGETKVCPQ